MTLLSAAKEANFGGSVSPSCDGRVLNIHDRLVHDGRVYSGSVDYTRGRVRSMQDNGRVRNINHFYK